MLISNIKDFSGIDLYKCKSKENQELLKAGFNPIGVDDDWYYYLLDEKLQEYLNKSRRCFS